MVNFEQLKADIQSSIKENGNGEITGNILKEKLLAIVDAIESAGYVSEAGDTMSGTLVVPQLHINASILKMLSSGSYNKMSMTHASDTLYVESGLSNGNGVNGKVWVSGINMNSLSEFKVSASASVFSGSITATAFYESSDETLKDFGEDIKIDFEKLKQIPKKYFTWKEEEDYEAERQIGTSAQEVQKLFPEIVGERFDGTLAVDYGKLSVVALKAVDELYEKNKALEERISRLEALILK